MCQLASVPDSNLQEAYLQIFKISSHILDSFICKNNSNVKKMNENDELPDGDDDNVNMRLPSRETSWEVRDQNLTPEQLGNINYLHQMLLYMNILFLMIYSVSKRISERSPSQLSTTTKILMHLISYSCCLCIDLTEILFHDAPPYIHPQVKNRTLDDFSPHECKNKFRFSKNQMQHLIAAIELPDAMRTSTGCVFTKVSLFTTLIIYCS